MFEPLGARVLLENTIARVGLSAAAVCKVTHYSFFFPSCAPKKKDEQKKVSIMDSPS